MKSTVNIKKKIYNPNKLPFLQAQILKRIYINISKNKETTLKELSVLTDYSEHSKILLSAINSLVKKRFLLRLKDDILDFFLPEERVIFFNKVIKESDYKNKSYSKKILNNFDNEIQFSLFNEKHTISELNRYGIIHKWYNYLEEFPYSLIEDKINEYNLTSNDLIVDPFAGSGTTLVSANLFHLNAIGFDTNPLMAFVSKVKTVWNIDLYKLKETITNIANSFLKQIENIDNIKIKNDFISRMPKKEINQWLNPILQKEVSLLKNIIDEIEDEKIKNLLLLALSKSCFDASYVSLCPGTTFYPFREKEEFWDLFTKKVIQMYKDLKLVQLYNNYGKSKIFNHTCLEANKYITKNSISFIITSPPYPNDLEYTRQTRLELYLLDFVKTMDDVQQIKRKMVKSSTKLIFKESESEKYIHKFKEIIEISNKIYEQTLNLILHDLVLHDLILYLHHRC